MPETPWPASAIPNSPALLVNFLAELSQVVASNIELQPILDWIVQKTTGLLRADEGSIRLMEEGGAPMKTLIRKRAPGLEAGSWEPLISMSVMGHLAKYAEPLATPDLLNDDRFGGLRQAQSRVRSVLAVPLRVENRTIGMLAVTNRTPGRQWTGEETQLLMIVATHSAGVIEQTHLRQKAKEEAEAKRRVEEENRRMEQELDVAHGIQMSLVPSDPLVSPPWEVHGRVVPARQVGGDYFDYFPVGDRFGVAIADVSGKGVPAAMIMSQVQTSLRLLCNGQRGLPEALSAVNRSMMRPGADGKFITLFYGEVDPGRGVLRYVNAGHNYPMLRRATGAVEELADGGMILGLFGDAEYREGETPFGPGDALLLYSDGLSEQNNHEDEMFGEDRLRSLWQSCCALPTAGVIDCLFDDVARFRGQAPQRDDMTAVIVGPRADS